jgi:hypothetical protein
MAESKRGETGARRLWLAAVAATIVGGILVPYGILGPFRLAYAVPIFWFLFGLVVIGLIVIGVSRWRDDP